MLTLKQATVVFLRRTRGRSRQLFIPKIKRGIQGGYLGGVGGKVETEESFLDCALRETNEEIKIIPLRSSFKHFATFHEVRRNEEGLFLTYEVCFYWLDTWAGMPQETDEVDPCDSHGRDHWYNEDKLPWEKMFPPHNNWLPVALRAPHRHYSVTGIFGAQGHALLEPIQFLPGASVLRTNNALQSV